MKIKELRIAKRLTQTRLAELCNVDQSTVNSWESGRRRPSFENLLLLADVLDCTIDALTGREQPPAPVAAEAAS